MVSSPALDRDAQYAFVEKAMAEAHADLREALRGVSDAQGAFRPSPERWTIAELAEHVAKAEKSFGVIVHYFMKRERGERVPLDFGPPKPTDLAATRQAVIETPKAEAPEVVVPGGDRPLSDSIRALEELVPRAAENLSRLRAFDETRASYPNPVYGFMNPLEWLYLTGLHKVRHTAQIRAVRGTAGFPKGGGR